MRLALAGGEASGSHIVMARGAGAGAVFDALPSAVTERNWPGSSDTERLEALVRQALGEGLPAMGTRLGVEDARRLSEAFLEESRIDPPLPFGGICCSLPPGMAEQSIGNRFVGRADILRRVHEVLHASSGGAAQLTSRITAGGGFGKTRVAVEYLHRYGPRYYPGGLFSVDAASSSTEGEFWRVLSALDPGVPDLAVMRSQGRDVRRELERALRGIGKPALYVIDNIPEAVPGEDPKAVSDLCPALGAVTVLATSRHDTREEAVQTIRVDTLERNSAILLLTENVPDFSALRWEEWGRIAEWVGDLPLALDLLNRSLALGAVTASELLGRVGSSATQATDALREALRGHVPAGAVRGVTEAFSISFESLDGAAQQVALLLAQMAPAAIPEEFMEGLPDEWRSGGVRAGLRSRHFVTAGGGLSFGVMHRLIADFLRGVAGELEEGLLEWACGVLQAVMTPDRCRHPDDWPVMMLCRPHAEELFARGSATKTAAVASSELGLYAAILASAQGDYPGARRLGEQVLEVRTRVLGTEHPGTLRAMGNLASTFWQQGDYPGARRIGEQVLEVMTRVLGAGHPDTLTVMGNLASTLRQQGDHAGARRIEEQVLEVSRRVLGAGHPDTLTTMNNLAETLRQQGDYAGARRIGEQVLEVRTRVLGAEHPATLTSMNNLAVTLFQVGEREAAVRMLRGCVAGLRKVLGEDHPNTIAAVERLRQWEGAG